MAGCDCGIRLMQSLRLLSVIASGMIESNVPVRKQNTLKYIEQYMTLKPKEYSDVESEIANNNGIDRDKKEYYLDDCPTGIVEQIVEKLRQSEDDRETTDTLEGIIAIMVNQANSSLKSCQAVK